jgi:antitoxin ParD1/3/4
MNINLGAQWEEFISAYIQSGRYLSASEVVREGLRLLQEREDLRTLRLEQLRKKIDAGMEPLDQGEYVELDEEGLKSHLERVKEGGRKRLAKEKRLAG